MKTLRAFLIALPLALSVAAWADQNPVGTWKGHLVVDASKMTLKDPNQIKVAQQQIAAAQKLDITLTIKADKTFTGNPPPSNGTWTMKGNQLTLSVKGKPNVQLFVLSKDGKTLTNVLPSRSGFTSKIVLKKI